MVIFIDSDRKQLIAVTGQRIRQLRNAKKLSQEELALRSGINPAYLGHLERGLKCPTIDTVNKIASALDISLSDFFNFDSNSTDIKFSVKRIQTTMQSVSCEDANKIAKIVESMVDIFIKN